MSETSVPAAEWQPRLESLIRTLTTRADLRSPEWMKAFAAIPRHVFIPEIIQTTDSGYRTLGVADRDAWLDAVYSDDSLVVAGLPHAAGYRLPSGDPLQVPTSSSTMPGLMARMLEALDVHYGMRVLEIGTGTGYNAALLAHRLGADALVSVDIDGGLVEAARSRLAELGERPTLVVGDGAEGAPGHAPFDRIIATAAVPDIPPAWLRQLAPGGKILANIRGDLAGGTVTLLTKAADELEAIGPVLPLGGHFMWLRPDPADPHRPHEQPRQRSTEPVRTVTTSSPSDVPVDDDGFRFLLQLELHGVSTLGRGTAFDPVDRADRDAIVLTTTDGSRAETFLRPTTDGDHRVIQTGPRSLWPVLESTRRLWQRLGRPDPGRYGVVATGTRGFVWLDDDLGWYRWPLPLV